MKTRKKNPTGRLNPKQKLFATLRANGVPQYEAYRQAGYRGSPGNACGVENRVQVRQEIDKVQNSVQEKIAHEKYNIVAECQKIAPEMISVLLDIARTSASETARTQATRELLDRAYGKPKELLEGKIDNRVIQIIRADNKTTNINTLPKGRKLIKRAKSGEK